MCSFLLVSLNIDAILEEVTIRQRRKILEEMVRGKGLSEAYTATLRRLKAQKGNKLILGQKVLMWVPHSERPLLVEELCHAMGVEMGSVEMDLENIPALRTLLASCLGLVTVEVSSSTVRLVHFTLKEHLSSDPTLFHNPHSEIADACLTYLNFEGVRDLSPHLDSPPSEMPLLEYASCFWGKHARRCATENTKILALRLLDRFDERGSARLLLLHHNKDRNPCPYFYRVSSGPTRFAGLHSVAFFGIAEILTAVLDMKEWDVNTSDSAECTALAWAAARGHEEVVRMLLEQDGVDPNKADLVVRTPLSWAAECGHEQVVRVLLERENVDPNKFWLECGKTPLGLAARHGHQRIVEMLLERGDIDPSRVSRKYRRTPLSWAAVLGHEEIVKILLKREDVDPNQAAGKYRRTPLSSAASCGHIGVVKVLLGRQDVDPNLTDSYDDRTPLLWALEGGMRKW